jgi:plastocyanin
MADRVARIGIVLGIVLAVSPLRPALAGGGGGCHGTTTTTARTTTIVIDNACFSPTLARVPVGATVTWINKDPFVHTVSGANGAWGSLDELKQDERITATFSKAGVYPYFCMFHPGMASAILVGDANGPGAATSQVQTGGVSREYDWSKDAAILRAKLQKAESRNASQRWFALPLGLATVALGFGIGRRRNGHNGNGTSHTPPTAG